MAPLVKVLKNPTSCIETVVLVTAQHREMLDQAMMDFGICSDYDLDIMNPGQTLAETTQRVLQGMTPILASEKPDMVLVHGDTTTAGSAALAAYYLRIPVGHVEAGLRTGDKYAPFPEEIMRKIADAISDVHFAPTAKAKENLLKENVPEEGIFVTGNTAVDALLMTRRGDYVFRDERLRQMDLGDKKNILVEVHRRENFDGGLDNVAQALSAVVRARRDVRLLVSVHKNPQARRPVQKHLTGKPRTVLFDPLDYPDFVNLIGRSYLLVSDSGGVQEEAPSLGVPVVVCREKTERPEAVEAGTVVLAGTNKKRVVDTILDLLDNEERYRLMSGTVNPFGDGRASDRIVQVLQYRAGLLDGLPQEFAFTMAK